jgi:endonuclease/exonuclease/phosphatase family metal-dependent hydrolase
MKVRFVGYLFFALTILWGCKTDKTPTSALEDPDPNGEEELLKAFKDSEGPGIVKVMSRNVYIGTNVTDLLDAPSIELIPLAVAAGFSNVLQSNFSERADALVTEIEKTLPHLIGLQEMNQFYIQSPGDFLDGNPVAATEIVLDFIEILEAALVARGLEYRVVKTVENADIELPMLKIEGDQVIFDDIRIKDHDVILARNDVVTSNEVAVPYDARLIIDESLGIFIPRGYVACDAQIGETSLVFANTHIESVDSVELKLAQVNQLLDAYKDESLPVILVGDFNSPATSGASYMQVLSEGYTDIWIDNPLTYNENGNTFGHKSDLRNESPNLFTRIDFIFAGPQGDPEIGEGFVLGDERRDITANGLWPSDHAGVVSKITYTVPSKLASN